MKKHLKLVAIVIFALAMATIAIIFTFNNAPSDSQQFSPHYLDYQGKPTKIFFLYSSTTYLRINETFVTPEGRTVQSGSLLFVVSVTLRNDYTIDDPPPPIGVPISPADGTAYLYLNSTLYDKSGIIEAPNVSNSDFYLSRRPGTGMLLVSGQTATANISMLVNQANVTRFDVVLVSLSDSIPI